MSQPRDYTRQYNFKDFQATSPSSPLPGTEVDAELNSVKLTLDDLNANIAKVQRDDGKLGNTTVHKDAFDQGALAIINSTFTPRGIWATASSYAVNDAVDFNGATYVATVAHTSSAAFATDTAASRWLLIANAALAGTSSSVDKFEGNGSTTAFTLSNTYASETSFFVFVNGELLNPVDDYTLSGTTLTLYTAPGSPSVAGNENLIVWGSNVVAQASQDAAEAAESNASGFADESESWATKTSGIVESTDYSSKAWATGGTGVDAGSGSAKDWASKTGGTVGNTSEYSAKKHAADGLASAGASETSKLASVAAQAAAETAETNSETAETNSAASASASQASRLASVAAQGLAETAQTNAETAAALATTNGAAQVVLATDQVALATTQAGLATTNGAAQVTLATTQAGLATTNGAAQVALATTQANNSANSASTASTQAGISTTKAGEASASASAAAASAASITDEETNAAASASAAAGSATASANSAAASAAALDTFDDRYLGSKTANPTLDNDGDALVAGALYFNSTANEMRVYDGANWIAASSSGVASMNLYEYTATSGQTTFTGSDDNGNSISFIAGNEIVVLNGVILDPSDYNSSSGTSIVLASGAATGDLLNVYAFKSFTVADTVSASTGGTFGGNIDVTGTVTADGLTVTSGSSIDNIVQVFGGGTIYAGLGVDGTGAILTAGSSGAADADLVVKTSTGGTETQRARFNDNGDISFYEDTGTTPKFFWDASAESLGIGTSTPSVNLEIGDGSGTSSLKLNSGTTDYFQIDSTGTVTNLIAGNSTTGAAEMAFYSSLAGTESEAMRIDSSGNLLVSKTAQSTAAVGVELRANGKITATIDGGNHTLNRTNSDGSILQFSKDNSSVGSIGIQSSGFYIDGEANHAGIRFSGNQVTPRLNGSDDNGNIILGGAANRFKDLYLSGGVYLGGTGASNKLDDVETGTWSPQFLGTGATFTMTLQDGHYSKIGTSVTVYFRATWSSKNGAYNTFILNGLPFTAKSNSGQYYYMGSTDHTHTTAAVAVEGNQTRAIFFNTSGGAVNNSSIPNSGSLVATVTYISAS